MKNNRLILRDIVKEDASTLVKWFNNKQLGRYMDDSEPDKTYDLEDIYEMMGSVDSHYLILQQDKLLIGYASLYNIVESKSEFSFLIGIPSMHNKGLGTLLLNLLSNMAFSIGIKTLYCWIYKNNQASIRCVKKAGFIIDNNQKSLNNEVKWYKNVILK